MKSQKILYMKKLIDDICGDNCYIAFLDILGFKNIVLDDYAPIDVAKIYKHIKTLRTKCSEDHGYNTDYDEALDDTLIRIFSDSIIIATPISFPDSLNIVAEMCAWIQQRLFEECHILLRGSITKGDIFYDDEVAFGSGLVKAYLNEEKAKFPRITIAKMLVDEYVDRVGTSRVTYITDFLLKDEDKLYFINYFVNSDKVKEWIKDQLAKEEVFGNVREKYLWVNKWLNLSEDEMIQQYAEQDYRYLFYIGDEQE